MNVASVSFEGLRLDEAEWIARHMDMVLDHDVPEQKGADAYRLLWLQKERYLNNEEYERLRDFKKIEDLHHLTINEVAE